MLPSPAILVFFVVSQEIRVHLNQQQVVAKSYAVGTGSQICGSGLYNDFADTISGSIDLFGVNTVEVKINSSLNEHANNESFGLTFRLNII